jgi:hypothetical protein
VCVSEQRNDSAVASLVVVVLVEIFRGVSMERLETSTPLISAEHADRQRKELAQIHARWLKKYPRKLPNALHHYTGAAGFHAIIKEQKMRATHISYLNDSSEYFHAIDLMREAIQSLKGTANKKIPQAPLEVMSAVLTTLDQQTMPPVFVTCFSEAKNELSQWRSYGNGEGGIALEMDAIKLGYTATAKGWEIHPVEYNLDRQSELIRAIVSRGCTTAEKLLHEKSGKDAPPRMEAWVKQYMYHAAYFAPLFKNAAFSQEREWRIIKWGIDPETLAVDVGGNTLRLRTMLDLTCEVETAGTRKRLLPITQVMIGPTPHTNLVRQAVQHHLQLHQCYGVTIEAANIPYRVLT